MIEFAAETENAFLSVFLNWNEIAAMAENEILWEKFLKIGMNLRLRQKMIMSLNKFVEIVWNCGSDRKSNSVRIFQKLEWKCG